MDLTFHTCFREVPNICTSHWSELIKSEIISSQWKQTVGTYDPVLPIPRKVFLTELLNLDIESAQLRSI